MGHPLALQTEPARVPRRPGRTPIVVAALLTALVFFACHGGIPSFPSESLRDDTPTCAQPNPVVPAVRTDITDKNYNGLFRNPEWRAQAAERLGQSVRINTETFDYLRDMPPPKEGKDVEERKGLEEFRKWLKETYPLVHKKLSLEVVNRYALLYTWEGSDHVSKPLVLCSHIDVVPVSQSSVDQWTYPPFSGHVDGEAVWGRGSVDTKNTLVGIVEAVEALLAADFVPQRTVILAFGYDEEISGYNGAKFLAAALLAKGLKDNVGLLVDEGPGIQSQMSSTFAQIGISEKGYTDVTISLSTPGGHSSIPPPHTNIGILSKLITELEAHPYTPELVDTNPFLASLQCLAEHAKDINPWLRAAIRNYKKVRAPLVKYLAKDSATRYMMTTSQAVDMMSGGVKLNALPEFSSAAINHRVATHQTVADVEAHLVVTLFPIAKSYNLNFTTIDHANTTHSHHQHPDSTAHLVVETYRGALEPAPISPSTGPVWDTLAGTVRRVAQDDWVTLGTRPENTREGEQSVFVTPVLMAANTDTRHYWSLTRNIYRYDPIRENRIAGIHTVNEHIAISEFIASIAFFHELIRNWQELAQ
ncbi:hypothetical protein DFJ77DRAFT_251395 [Powellomyces hirtus]|nr:hypothetical protein DFJ77DRAFT_251395 [Powellomyces hirtus]